MKNIKIITTLLLTTTIAFANVNGAKKEYSQLDIESQKLAKQSLITYKDYMDKNKDLKKCYENVKTYKDFKNCKFMLNRIIKKEKNLKLKNYYKETKYAPKYKYKAAEKYNIDLYKDK
jgi:hypothetical protein